MNEEKVKIRLKISEIEIEYEGKDSFLGKGLSDLIQETISAHSKVKDVSLEVPVATTDSPSLSTNDLSTNSIAGILNVKTGPELILAAAVHITLVQGKDDFSRDDLRKEMKNATSYYKQTYGTNLISYIGRMVKKNELLERRAGSYALPADAKESYRVQLDQHQ